MLLPDMSIEAMTSEGYRSIRELTVSLDRLNVFVGGNGTGKSNLFRSLLLIHRAAEGELAEAIAEEGGMPSALWAGPRGRGPVRMSLGVKLEMMDYEISLGLPVPSNSAFALDPQIKEEKVWLKDKARRILLLDRKGSTATTRDDQGNKQLYPLEMSESESILAQIREPHRYPLLSALRQELSEWRFFQQFRTDPDSPLRSAQPGFRSWHLSHDGRNLAATLQTIIESGGLLSEAVDDAFPGAGVIVQHDQSGFRVGMTMPGFARSFEARELSDGTLRYLCLLAALTSPRKPRLLAFNEPETSLHPDLLAPLARLFERASRDCQILVTTHSERLGELLRDIAGVQPVVLEKLKGETIVRDTMFGFELARLEDS